MFIWIAVIVVLLFVSAILFYEIYYYEGVHLGPRIQGWFYDHWASKYDSDKKESQSQDIELLARPLLDALAESQDGALAPLVLDVATGTGRLPLALFRERNFTGHVVGLDISRGMLSLAAEKLALYKDRTTLVRHAAVPLPFPENTFDVVCCLESLEIMPNLQAPLAEFARVLRPGGILITSRGREDWGLVGKVRGTEAFETLLRTAGFGQVEIMPWWKMFDRVWACKPGQSTMVGPRVLSEILCCPACGEVALTSVPLGALRCEQCKAEVPISPEGIVLC